MTHLRDANFSALERMLEHVLNARRVWIQYSNNKSNVRICITVFSQTGYEMYLSEHVKDFSFGAMRTIIATPSTFWERKKMK